MFTKELLLWHENADDEALLDELRPLLPSTELPGLPLKIRVAIARIAEDLAE